MKYLIPYDKRYVRITLELVSPVTPLQVNQTEIPLVEEETLQGIEESISVFNLKESLVQIIGSLLKPYEQ